MRSAHLSCCTGSRSCKLIRKKNVSTNSLRSSDGDSCSKRTLLRARVCLMSPEERTSTFAIRARRHVIRHFEIRVHRPHASLVDREYNKVLRLDFPCIGFVGNGKRAAARVVLAGRMELRKGLTRARVVRLDTGEGVAAGRIN